MVMDELEKLAEAGYIVKKRPSTFRPYVVQSVQDSRKKGLIELTDVIDAVVSGESLATEAAEVMVRIFEAPHALKRPISLAYRLTKPTRG